MTNIVKSAPATKALFLDRDGVINVDHGYVGTYADFEYINGIFAVIKQFQLKGYQPVIVTNQSGIARGFYTETEFQSLMERVQKDFTANNINSIPVYFCPHHKQGSISRYAISCECRKPAPGMLLKAAKDLNIDLCNSVLIGDSWRDIQAADAAGLKQSIFLSKEVVTPEQAEGLSEGHKINIVTSLSEISPP